MDYNLIVKIAIKKISDSNSKIERFSKIILKNFKIKIKIVLLI